jgi:hypothetical protein
MRTRIDRIRRVRDIRKRVRDLAAAQALAGELRVRGAELEHEKATQAHTGLLEDAAARLMELGVKDLLLLDGSRKYALYAIEQRKRYHERMARESAPLRRALGQRERELRLTERLLDRARDERDVQEGKAEQKAADDLAGARFKEKL